MAPCLPHLSLNKSLKCKIKTPAIGRAGPACQAIPPLVSPSLRAHTRANLCTVKIQPGHIFLEKTFPSKSAHCENPDCSSPNLVCLFQPLLPLCIRNLLYEACRSVVSPSLTYLLETHWCWFHPSCLCLGQVFSNMVSKIPCLQMCTLLMFMPY